MKTRHAAWEIVGRRWGVCWWQARWLMTDKSFLRHLSSGLVICIWINFVIVMSVNFISTSCISREYYSYETETSQLLYFYEQNILWSHFGYEWVILILILMIVVWTFIEHLNIERYTNYIMPSFLNDTTV
jgi:hypothetical protein